VASELPSVHVNNGVTIKAEPGEVKTEACHKMDEAFSGPSTDFMLFQLPDTLPGRAPDPGDPGDPPEGQSLAAAASETTTASKAPNNFCNLEHFEEGLIGKLVRYRSGKTKLELGDMTYDVDTGLTPDFQQHAVSISSNREQRSASMFSLGQVNAKFNVTPDWQHLFHKMTP